MGGVGVASSDASNASQALPQLRWCHRHPSGSAFFGLEKICNGARALKHDRRARGSVPTIPSPSARPLGVPGTGRQHAASMPPGPMRGAQQAWHPGCTRKSQDSSGLWTQRQPLDRVVGPVGRRADTQTDKQDSSAAAADSHTGLDADEMKCFSRAVMVIRGGGAEPGRPSRACSHAVALARRLRVLSEIRTSDLALWLAGRMLAM